MNDLERVLEEPDSPDVGETFTSTLDCVLGQDAGIDLSSFLLEPSFLL